MYIFSILKSIFNVIYISIFMIYKYNILKKIKEVVYKKNTSDDEIKNNIDNNNQNTNKSSSFLQKFNIFEEDLKKDVSFRYMSHNRMIYLYFFLSFISCVMTAIALKDFKGSYFNIRIKNANVMSIINIIFQLISICCLVYTQLINKNINMKDKEYDNNYENDKKVQNNIIPK